MDRAGPALSVVAALLRAHEVHVLAHCVEKRRPHVKRDAVVATIHIQDELGKVCVAFNRWCRQGACTQCDRQRGKTGCRAKQSPAARAMVVVLTHAYPSMAFLVSSRRRCRASGVACTSGRGLKIFSQQSGRKPFDAAQSKSRKNQKRALRNESAAIKCDPLALDGGLGGGGDSNFIERPKPLSLASSVQEQAELRRGTSGGMKSLAIPPIISASR
jgi:hypothetical protein